MRSNEPGGFRSSWATSALQCIRIGYGQEVAQGLSEIFLAEEAADDFAALGFGERGDDCDFAAPEEVPATLRSTEVNQIQEMKRRGCR
jgi:hypothetical protein